MQIVLYDEGVTEELDVKEIAQYLTQKMGKVKVEVRENPFTSSLVPEKVSDYAKKFASIKIQGVGQAIPSWPEPLYGEIEYEKRRILGKTKAFGVLYDGFRLQRIFGELIPREEHRRGFVHIVFTNRLFATWEEGERRYHARTSVYGLPSLISTTGLVEAPAKPREYYLLKQQYEAVGRDLMELNGRFKGSFVDYGDERLTEATKGYAMQAVFFSLTGTPFCEDKGCRLYNAHWQEELVFAQLEDKPEFCPRHTRILEDFVRDGDRH